MAPGGIWRCLLVSEVVEAQVSLNRLTEAKQSVADAIDTINPSTFEICSSMRATTGDLHSSKSTLKSLLSRSSVPVPAVVRLSAALDETDLAFEWIDVAIDSRVWNIVKALRTDPLFKTLRQDARWKSVEDKLTFEEQNCSLCS